MVEDGHCARVGVDGLTGGADGDVVGVGGDGIAHPVVRLDTGVADGAGAGALLEVGVLHLAGAEAARGAVQDIDPAGVGGIPDVLGGVADDQVGAAVLVDLNGALAPAVHHPHDTRLGIAANDRLRVGDGDVLQPVADEVGDTHRTDRVIHPGIQVIHAGGDTTGARLGRIDAKAAALVGAAGEGDHLAGAVGGAHHGAAGVAHAGGRALAGDRGRGGVDGVYRKSAGVQLQRHPLGSWCARTTSRSVRSTSSTTSWTEPAVPVRSAPPMVAVVSRRGLPAGTARLTVGLSAKQLGGGEGGVVGGGAGDGRGGGQRDRACDQGRGKRRQPQRSGVSHEMRFLGLGDGRGMGGYLAVLAVLIFTSVCGRRCSPSVGSSTGVQWHSPMVHFSMSNNFFSVPTVMSTSVT